ncbi:hypothetical protein FRC14_002941 [Serendipita sp. 396]|nr:hypothetical protein FRC14_002941 [Serendipita sp. 396]KAG8797354.1 hypothetical protein FRC16_008995 [Serendipita sp. 398]
MSLRDRTPDARHEYFPSIRMRHNNRYGAVLVAVLRFLSARRSVDLATKDAYSCILFDRFVQKPFIGDDQSTPEQLIEKLVEVDIGYGTRFNSALAATKQVLRDEWQPKRLPVVVFLSDGEGRVEASEVRDLCQEAIKLGYDTDWNFDPYSPQWHSTTTEMATLAYQAYRTARPQASAIPCRYSLALDVVALEDTFLTIAESLRSTRAGLVTV